MNCFGIEIGGGKQRAKILSPKKALLVFGDHAEKEIEDVSTKINAALADYTGGLIVVELESTISTKVLGEIAASCTKEGWMISYSELPENKSKIELRPASNR